MSVINPMISIVVPVYNMEKHLDCCMDSLINQTYQNTEIIIVDDGSTDESSIMCDNYGNNSTNIKVIHKKNGGLSSARNAGISAARGAYIGFVDSDDYVHPKMYERLLAEIAETGADIAVCQFKYVNEKNDDYIDKNEGKRICTNSPKESLRNLMNCNQMVNSGIMCDKLFDIKLFENLRFPEGRYHEDEFIIHHLFGKATRITYISDVLYYYRMREGSITSRYSLKNADMLLAHEDRLEYYKENYPELINEEVEWYLNLLDYNYFKMLRYHFKEKESRRKIIEVAKNVLEESKQCEYISKDIYNKYKLFVKAPLIYKISLKIKSI